MEILSHRGLWHSLEERNDPKAFARSFDHGLGVETDLRDHNGEIVIAHDLPTGSPLRFAELLEMLAGRNLPLALNIKADGLGPSIKKILAQFGHDNYFVFDMSICELIKQTRDGMIAFTGLSDIQPSPVLLEKCKGIWLDCFESEWYAPHTIDHYINQGKQVCVVSAELHGRSSEKQWHMLKSTKSIHHPHLLLCTDKPLEAQRFFEIKQ